MLSELGNSFVFSFLERRSVMRLSSVGLSSPLSLLLSLSSLSDIRRKFLSNSTMTFVAFAVQKAFPDVNSLVSGSFDVTSLPRTLADKAKHPQLIATFHHVPIPQVESMRERERESEGLLGQPKQLLASST
jgi:hypothetical protein